MNIEGSKNKTQKKHLTKARTIFLLSSRCYINRSFELLMQEVGYFHVKRKLSCSRGVFNSLISYRTRSKMTQTAILFSCPTNLTLHLNYQPTLIFFLIICIINFKRCEKNVLYLTEIFHFILRCYIKCFQFKLLFINYYHIIL